MVPRFGWPSIYQLGGWTAIGLVAVLFIVLPESARFLVMRTQDRNKLVSILRKLAPDVSLPADAIFVTKQEQHATASVVELFKDDRRIKTMTLWVASFGSMVALRFITSWMPAIFADGRLGYSWAVIAVGLFQTGEALGGFAAGWVLDRRGGSRFGSQLVTCRHHRRAYSPMVVSGGLSPVPSKKARNAARLPFRARSVKYASASIAAIFSATAMLMNWFTLVPSAVAMRSAALLSDGCRRSE
jgi:hypothetical protein